MKKRISVFGSHSKDTIREEKQLAYKIGQLIGSSDSLLIYGGGSTGVMGELYKGYMSTNPVTLPLASTTNFILDVEKPADHLLLTTEKDMRSRNMIYDYGDDILVLCGGIGTQAEFFYYLVEKKFGRWPGSIFLIKDTQYSNVYLNYLHNLCDMGVVGRDIFECVKVVTIDEFEAYLSGTK